MKPKILAALALAAASSLNAQTVAPPAPAELGSAAPLTGTWAYARTADGSETSFRSESPLPQLTVRCTRSVRRVTISKPASAAAPALFIWTSNGTRSLPATFDPATAQLSADLPAFDTFLDAIAFSRGRFGVSVSGVPPLVVPAWSETSRVVEDCRV